MTDRTSSSKEISMTKVTDLIERLKDDSSDFVYHERHEAAAELLRLSSECEALREAVRREALEEAAKVVDEAVEGAWPSSAIMLARQLASGIRDLMRVDAPKGLDDG